MRPILFVTLFFVMILTSLDMSAQTHTVRRNAASSQTRTNAEKNSMPRKNILTNHHLLKGSFYNNKHSWPVEFSIQIENDGGINGVYKNISQKVSLEIVGTYHSNGSIELYDPGRTLYLSLSRTSSKEWRGSATSGATTLKVVLSE